MSYSPSVAFLTGSVGTGEWIVLFVVVLIVVGPKRLPEVARKIGRMMEMFRRAADEFKDQLMTMDQTHSPSGSASTPASDPSDASGHYENPYPDSSDYPGNEGHVENWSSESLSDSVAGESHGEPAGEATRQEPAAADSPAKPGDGGA